MRFLLFGDGRDGNADFARLFQRIVLVGGYGESGYLKNVLRETYASQGIQVVTSDEPSKKAVAEGSIIWFVKRLVVARSVRATYGLSIVYPFNRDNQEHVSFSLFAETFQAPLLRTRVYLADYWTSV